jgi:ubiquitin thioesterase CYLD
MSSGDDEWYYIACRDIPLQRGTWKELKDRVWSSQSPEHLLKGELLVIEGDGTRDVVRGRMALDRTKKFECPTDNIAYVTNVEYRILAPIKSPGERWDVFKDKQRMEKLKDLRVDEHIWITLPMGKDPKSGLIGSSCLRGTIRYIGGIHEEIGTYFGIELQDPKGTCDGSFKEGRYFLCADNHGIFLSASHLNLTKSKQASSKVPRGEVVLPLVKSKSGQEFCKDDKVFVFDKNCKRIFGKVKWAYRRQNIEDHIIGIETDSSDTSYHKFPDHVPDCSHLFKELDHKRHSYLALPETVVGKVEPEADEQIMSKSLQNTVSQIAMHHAVSTKALLDEQSKVMEEGQKKKEQEVAKELGLSTLEFKEHKEAMKKFKQKQEEIDRNRPLYQNSTTHQGEKIALPGTSIHERSDESSEYRRKSEEDILPRHNVTNVDREALKRQQSEGHSPQLPRKSHLVYSFSVGSLVEVPVGEKNMYGTVRWTGTFPQVKEPIAGVELDEWHSDCGDGSWKNTEYFKCRNGHGMFIAMSKLRPDPRYPTHVERGRNPLEEKLQGRSTMIDEPVESPKAEELSKLIGEKRGIQGHQNSCYLDSTLFAMYGFTGVFDNLILEEPQGDVAEDIVQIMSCEIINPLRKNGVVTFDHVMNLRHALDKLNKMKGLTHAEQDPEEFLNLLFKHVLKVAEPFINLKRPSGTDTEFFLQLFVEKSEKMLFTMKEMLFQCMKEQRISFAKAPRQLIIQLPRYGKDFKVYERIYPELHMEVSDICADYISPDTVCGICGGPPKLLCLECGTKETVFQDIKHYWCSTCNRTLHQHPQRQDHKPERFDIKAMSQHKVTLDLLSVVCIEKSHYVCFSRHGRRWFFFDSMADRTDDGFNIPCVQECPEIGEGLEDIEVLKNKPPTSLPPLLRRLVNDASICIYVDPEVEMYT